MAKVGHPDPPSVCGSDYDRAKELKAFDETEAGVKGLVDSGLVKIPRIFIHPPENLPGNSASSNTQLQIPVIDLNSVDGGCLRDDIVDEIRRASETWGFFQVVNHGIPVSVLDEMLSGAVRFHEQPSETKKAFYSREPGRKVRFSSNFDLYTSSAANWRDTMFCSLAPDPPKPEELPLVCREIMIEYVEHVARLGETLFQLLSKALGLSFDHLKSLGCMKGHVMLSHYYPTCPESKLTLGTSKHSDPSFLTILLQDQVGGLQILHQQHWVDVCPLHGSLVVNIGDLLQLISNDKFKSVEHRVLAQSIGPRASVAYFFTTNEDQYGARYGPIQELLSDDNPPRYREILLKEFTTHYDSKGLDGISALSRFKL